jgi:hypothetical protein
MLPVAVVASTMAAFAGNESSSGNSDVSFEIEPPLLIQNRPVETRPTTAAADADPARLEKDLERAKRIATGAERLCKIGALSKLEAEQRALKVIRLESNLEDARLARAKQELDTQQGRLADGGVSKEDVRDAELSVARATAAAEAAAAKRQRAELEAAEVNLHRQQRLLALGSARKSDVARAEQKLAELQPPKN